MKTILYPLIFISFLSKNLAQSCNAIELLASDYSVQADAIVCSETTELQFSDRNNVVITKRKSVIILNDAGRRHGHTVVFYDKNQKIKKASARFYNKFGKETKKISKKDFKDQSAINDFSLYEDSRVLYYDEGPADYPYIVEYEYSYETSNTLYLPTWNPISSYNLSVLESNLIINFPADMTFNKSESNLEDYDISISENLGQLRYSLSAAMPIKEERYSMPLSSFGPRVKLSPTNFSHEGINGEFNSWEDVGRWIEEELLIGQDQLSADAISDIKSLTKGVTDDREKVRLVYEYMQQKCRYISVQIGIGGWKPMHAADVHRLSYGDCKALVNYTKALLNVAAVPSYYTIVYAGRVPVDIDSSFTSLQGNHAILQVPFEKDTMWLECTNDKAAPGYISGFTDDRDVLVVYPEGGTIIHTKKYTEVDNRKRVDGTMQISEDGSLAIDAIIESKGAQYGAVKWLNSLKEDEIDKYYKRLWNLPGVEIGSVNFSDNRTDELFTAKLKMKVPAYVQKMGNLVMFRPYVLRLDEDFNTTTSLEKKYDFFLEEGRNTMYEFIIEIPEGFELEDLPKALELEHNFGKYTYSCSPLEGNRLQFRRTLFLKKGRYDKADYYTYADFIKSINKNDEQYLLFKKN
jgi:hypothetical protein